MVQNEWVESIQDFVIRRTDMLYFEPQKLQNNLVEIANKLADLKQWDIIKKESELVEIQKLITQSINF
jgi:glycerol-3-phosphate dehydrogenase